MSSYFRFNHNRFMFQIAQDLLSQCQNNSFVEMINDIIRQVKANPQKIPVPSIYKRNLEKVSCNCN